MSEHCKKSVGPRPAVRIGAAALLLILTSAWGKAWAGPSVAQAVRVGHEILDERGKPLRGTDPAAGQFGHEVVEGDLVQVLLVTDGAIHPPDAQGNPDPRNVLLGTTRIGRGVAPHLANPARFGATVTPRPGGGSRIFVRVFNAASTDTASFYGDSQLFTVTSYLNEVFTADLAATSLPLDTADDDGDGLNNSWEKSLGSNAAAADTDGDGLSDGEEQLAGTDVLDAESVLAVADVSWDGEGLRLKWESSEGRTYRVEHMPADVPEGSGFTTLETVQAVGGLSEVVLPLGLSTRAGWYRVSVVE